MPLALSVQAEEIPQSQKEDNTADGGPHPLDLRVRVITPHSGFSIGTTAAAAAAMVTVARGRVTARGRIAGSGRAMSRRRGRIGG